MLSNSTGDVAAKAAETAETPSQLARQRGNALYRKGEFRKAIAAFQEAVDLDPRDASPPSNLSAAYHETGNYVEAVRAAEQALELIADVGNEAEPQRQKLYGRLFRSLMSSWSIDEAEKYARRVVADKQRADHLAELDTIRPFVLSAEKKAAVTAKLVDVPRYVTPLQTHPEFTAVRNETPETQAIEDLFKSAGPYVAWMFGRIGDARHLYRTLIGIARYEVVKKTASQQYRMTITDSNAACIVRDLIIFVLLDDLSNCWQDEEAMAAVSYAFLETVIPGFAWDRIQKAIERLRTALKEGRQPLEWAFIPPRHNAAIFHCLDKWTGDLGPKFTAATFQQFRRDSNKEQQAVGRDLFGMETMGRVNDVPKGCQGEVQIFPAIQTILPPKALLAETDPELSALVDGLRARHKPLTEVNKQLVKTWKPNPTFVDFDWMKYREDERICHGPTTTHDSFEVATTFHSSIKGMPSPNGFKKKECTLDYIGQFFVYTALAINKLRKRLVIEVVADEMAATMERIRLDMLEHRREDKADESSKGKETAAVPKFAKLFHRIHMSNLPDYIGNHLTTFIYAAPLIDPRPGPDTATGFLSANMLNPASFTNQQSYLTEHLLLHHDELVRSHFGVQLDRPSARLLASIESEDQATGSMSSPQSFLMAQLAMQSGIPPEVAMAGMAGMGMGMPGGGGMPFLVGSGYWTWELSPPYPDVSNEPTDTTTKTATTPVIKPALLTREGLTHYLHAHLLKAAFPHPRPPHGASLVMAPLNLSVFLRLVVHLARRDLYPGHWLAGILTGIAAAADVAGDGTISTTARAPTKGVHDGSCAAAVPQAKDIVAADEKRGKKAAKEGKAHRKARAFRVPEPKEPPKALTFPRRAVSIRAIAAEYSTLLAMWRPTLPFSFPTPPATVPAPSAIGRYVVRFPADSWADLYQPGGPRGTKFSNKNVFVLLFWDAAALGSRASGPANLRCLIDDESTDAQLASQRDEETARRLELDGGVALVPRLNDVRSLRENRFRGVHVVSCMEWNGREEESEGLKGSWEARFWLRDDAAEEMAKEGGKGDWRVFVYRTDTTDLMVKGVDVKKALTRVGGWME